MSLVPVENLGRIGVVSDTPAHDLPPEAWTNARNVRFRNNRVEKMDGYSEVYATPSIVPYWLLSVPASTYYWIVAGAAKVHVTDGTSYTDITRSVGGDYSMDNDILWNGGLLGGVPVINNGVDVPQFWNPQTAATKLADLTAWPADTTAKVIRPFLNFLFALDITKSGTEYQHMVKWSHAAEPGTVPTTWDETDETADAGETDLTDTAAGPCIDALPLHDALMIYKEGSTHGVLYTGDRFVFKFYKIFENLGAMSASCISLIGEGERHLVMSGDDMARHDGQNAQSVLTRRMRRWLANAMNTDRYKRSFMVRNVHERETWFCFPESGYDWPNLALVYDWDSEALTVRELSNNASFIAPGRIIAADTNTWDSDSEVWDADSEVWDASAHPPYQFRLVQAAPNDTMLFYQENTNKFNGVSMQSYVERTGLAVFGRDRDGAPKVDNTMLKQIKGVRPKITGGAVNIRVGVQQQVGGDITWTSPLLFTPGVDYKVDCCLVGRFAAVRFEGATDTPWYLDSYDLDIEPLGQF